MSVLRVVAVSLLGFLLSLSLVIFGLVFTVKMTALNAGYVTSRLDALDVSAVAEEVLEDEASKGELPEELTDELRTALLDTIDRLEVTIKEQAGAGINATYDYLLGKKDSPELALTLRNTFLNSEFVTSLLDQLDIPSLVAKADVSSLALDFLSRQSSEEVPEEITYLTGYIDEIIIELEPWLKEQAAAAAAPIFSYLLGESQSLNVSISMEPVKEALGGTLRADFLKSPPAELSGLSQAELGQYFDEHYGELAEELPLAYEIRASDLESARAEMTQALGEASTALEESREYVGYFQLGYNLLIVFMILLTAGIVLIYREVKGTALTLGIIYLTIGALELVGVLVARALIKQPLAQMEAPASLVEWTAQTASSSLTPLLELAIFLLVLGAALLAVYFVYRRRQP